MVPNRGLKNTLIASLQLCLSEEHAPFPDAHNTAKTILLSPEVIKQLKIGTKINKKSYLRHKNIKGIVIYHKSYFIFMCLSFIELWDTPTPLTNPSKRYH